jgi:protein involved in polysaccharide export with SLBB domain
MRSQILCFIGLVITAAGCSDLPHHSKVTSAQQVTPDVPSVYVAGEVIVPGRYAWTNGMTLQDAVSAAGGFTDFAPRRLRVNHNGVSTLYRLGPDRTFTNNPAVQAGDSIYSPRSIF